MYLVKSYLIFEKKKEMLTFVFSIVHFSGIHGFIFVFGSNGEFVRQL